MPRGACAQSSVLISGEHPRDADLVAYSMAGDEADRTAGRMCKALKRTEDEYMMVCAGDTKSAYATLDALPDGHRETCREWGLKKTKIVIGENYGRVIDVAELLLQRRDVTGDEIRAALWS